MLLNIGGCDPSLRNFGLAKGIYDTDSKKFDLTQLKLINPKVVKTKKMRVNEHDLLRAQDLVMGLNNFLNDCDLIFVELPVGSQSSRAAVSYGICVGVIASLHNPLIITSAKQGKLLMTGDPEASKATMIQYAYKEYPNANWSKKKDGTLLTCNEHLADAIAAIHAGLQSKQFLLSEF